MPKTVLFVDDSASIRQLVEFTLAHEGYTLVVAENGRQGLSAARRHRPALILTDLNMPEMGGLAMLSELRRDPVLAKTPVLVLTTESTDATREQVRAAGAQGWLVKPFAPAKLVAVVKAVMGG